MKSLLFAILIMAAPAVCSVAQEAGPLRVHFLSGSKEYQSEPSLKAFVADLDRRYRGIVCTASWGKDKGKSLENFLKMLRNALFWTTRRDQDAHLSEQAGATQSPQS